MRKYFDIAFTPAVTEVQSLKGAREHYARAGESWPVPTRLNEQEVTHIQAADSFYLASVSESGWPYVQHRGGDKGFVTVLDDHTIGWLERTGNRQYISSGNIAANDKLAIIMVDYPSRTRLKLYGNANNHIDPSDELISRLGGDGIRNDGAVTVEVVSYDWNCPKYITPRFTEEQIREITAPLEERIRDLEAELARSTNAGSQ
jgi:predicted pyridoxine 5'-phosphate oxidase superfamily flavin-nucleotide-binding protein